VSETQCNYIIGYTSFEEVARVVVQNQTALSKVLYRDALGGDTNHSLMNNVGQFAVSYDVCAAGKLEMGFSSFCKSVL
jgi:hypothetical protein